MLIVFLVDCDLLRKLLRILPDLAEEIERAERQESFRGAGGPFLDFLLEEFLAFAVLDEILPPPAAIFISLLTL